jgi:hypothetical protein
MNDLRACRKRNKEEREIKHVCRAEKKKNARERREERRE